MNREILIKEIRDLLEVINEQQEVVLSHQETIPQIEMDILKGNIRKLYERLMALEMKPATITPARQFYESVQPEELIARTEVSLPVQINNVADQKEPQSQPAIMEEPKVIDEIKAEAHIQPELIVANVETPVVPASSEIINEAVLPQAGIAKERAREFSRPQQKSKSTASLFDETPTIAEKFQGVPTLYDKIAAASEDKSIGEKLKKNPVSDLKKSIGINEKFAFINELFDGDLDHYNHSIDLLNSSNSYDEAMEMLTNTLAAKFNWSNDGTTFMQLKTLLERRFIA